MDSDNLIGVIELGGVNIRCVIFSVNSENVSEILSSSIVKSEGIYNSKIVNFSKAANSIRSCISSAEKEAKVLLKKINVIFEQTEFLCTKFSKHKKIDGTKIQKEDIEFLLKDAKKQVTQNDNTQSIIHIFNHNYIVDGKSFIEEPINIYANSLSHEMTFVTAPKNNLKNIKEVFIDCDIEVERFISSTFALGAELLNEDQLDSGSILIDLGFEKISLGLFKNLALVHSVTLPIGINHIVKDISKVCSLSKEESEVIKNKIDYSFINNANMFDENNYLKENYFKDSYPRKLSQSLILNILQARLDEILEMIKKQVLISGLSFGNNIFITGGGSRLINIETYFSNFLKLNVKKLSGKNEDDKKKKIYEAFNSCIGAFKIIQNGWETEAIPQSFNKSDEKKGFFAKIFG
tara:strand:+ start:17019 stop:18239 length:1221 start_codon:yes stop_codon:yes gene_type:complete